MDTSYYIILLIILIWGWMEEKSIRGVGTSLRAFEEGVAISELMSTANFTRSPRRSKKELLVMTPSK
jgi:hypothetical protein